MMGLLMEKTGSRYGAVLTGADDKVTAAACCQAVVEGHLDQVGREELVAP